MQRRIAYARVRAPLFSSLICLASLAAFVPGSSAAPAPQSSDAAAARSVSKTIGLVLTDWRYALYETTDAKEECSLGVQKGEPAQARAQQGYLDLLKRYGGSYENRGPNGENANFNPTTVDDPLPFSELTTKKGFGLNLDGTRDGHATAKTCAHDKFTSPESEEIDNQMARVVGCVQGYRTSGLSTEYQSTEVVTSVINRQLIEITGVDDEVNDPSVDVALYKGRDVITRTASGDKFVPLQSHRVDARFPQYMVKVHGRIIDGVLITDPIPAALLPARVETNIGDRDFKNLTLRLKLTPDGAEGLFAGYESVDTWYSIHARKVVAGLSKFSSASLYRALHRYADGYPDPKTGQCTRISATYKVKAVRALIVHGPKDQPRVVSEATHMRMAQD